MIDKMRQLLEGSSLPRLEIKVYGQRITVECLSHKAAQRWGRLLAGAKLRNVQILKTTVLAKVNQKTVMNPSRRQVWRVYAEA